MDSIELKDKLLDLLMEEGTILHKTVHPKREPTHGPCCTCQDCGHYHDDCVCYSNLMIEKIDELFNEFNK